LGDTWRYRSDGFSEPSDLATKMIVNIERKFYYSDYFEKILYKISPSNLLEPSRLQD